MVRYPEDERQSLANLEKLLDPNAFGGGGAVPKHRGFLTWEQLLEHKSAGWTENYHRPW